MLSNLVKLSLCHLCVSLSVLESSAISCPFNRFSTSKVTPTCFVKFKVLVVPSILLLLLLFLLCLFCLFLFFISSSSSSSSSCGYTIQEGEAPPQLLSSIHLCPVLLLLFTLVYCIPYQQEYILQSVCLHIQWLFNVLTEMKLVFYQMQF